MLINVKMPTIVGILTFMSRINCVLSRVEYEKSLITWGQARQDVGLDLNTLMVFLKDFFQKKKKNSMQQKSNEYIMIMQFMIFINNAVQSSMGKLIYSSAPHQNENEKLENF